MHDRFDLYGKFLSNEHDLCDCQLSTQTDALIKILDVRDDQFTERCYFVFLKLWCYNQECDWYEQTSRRVNAIIRL